MKKVIGILIFASASIGWGHSSGDRIPTCKYMVHKNDTLAKLKRLFDFISQHDPIFDALLMESNPKLKNLDQIYPGHILNVPILGIISKVETLPIRCENVDSHLAQKKTLVMPQRDIAFSTVAPIPLKNKTHFTLKLSSLFESIHSRSLQKTTVLVSESQPQLSLELNRQISQNWSSLLNGSYTRQSYLGTNGGTVSLDQKTFATSQVNFGFQYSWEKNSFLQFTFGFGDFAYYRALSATQYDLIVNKVARIKTLFNQSLFVLGPVDTSLVFGLGYSGKSEKDGTLFGGGLDHGFGIQTAYELNPNHQLSLRGYYSQGQYRSDVGGFEKRWLQLSLQYLVGF